MDSAAWFSPPCSLLPAPSNIIGDAVNDAPQPRRARRPPALASAQPAMPRRPKPRTAPVEENLELPDRARDVVGVIHLRHGRFLRDGQVVAVPQQVQDLDDELQDAQQELLVVDLSRPGGSWFEDAEVSSVLVSMQSEERLIPIGDVREHVRRRVDVFARPTPSLRKLEVPCRLPRFPLHVFVLIALRDLLDGDSKAQ
jgi:hypothetical protein